MATDLEQKIIKQIEYYFGDFNLPRDKFLKEKIQENEGWVEVSVLLTFKRLSSLSTDAEVIVKAVEKSDAGLVAVSEDRTKIRRVPEKPLIELDDDKRKEIVDRTAYAKGFPLDEPLEDIIIFMEQQGAIDSCIKRSYVNKSTKEHVFKGSCFVVFKDKEDCKKFIESENMKYKDVELIRKWQSVYIEEKRNENQKLRKEQKKKIEDKKILEQTEKKSYSFPKGAFLYFSGIAKETVLTREEIKEKMTEIYGSEPVYIDFQKGDVEGYIRMSDENGAVEFVKKLTDGILEIGETKIQFKVLEGQEEEVYTQKTIAALSNRRQNKRSHRHQNKGRNADGPRVKKARH